MRAPAAAKARAPPLWSEWACVRIRVRTGFPPVVSAMDFRISAPLDASAPESTATTPSPRRNHPTFAPFSGCAAHTPSATLSTFSFDWADTGAARTAATASAVTRARIFMKHTP